jgi:hypothetical protein
MGTVIFLVLCALVLRALATTPARPLSTGSRGSLLRAWEADIVAGARALARLDAVRHERLGDRPWR